MSSAESRSSSHRQIPIVCPGHTRPLAELQFCTPRGEPQSKTLLVSACHDKMPMVRDGISGDWIGTFKGHKGAVWSCCLDPQGFLAATASGDYCVKIWDAINGKELVTLPHEHIVKTCSFSMDSTRLATGGHEGILRIYDLTSNFAQLEPYCKIPQDDEKRVIITKCLWLDDSTVIASASDGYIRFWKVQKHELEKFPPVLLRTFQVSDEVRDMELVDLAHGDNILTVAAGEEVSFFDMKRFLKIRTHTVPIHFRNEGGASLHPSGKKFVAGGSDLWVRLFDFETGLELECMKGHHGPIRCVRCAPDGKTYATGSEDGTIRLWETSQV